VIVTLLPPVNNSLGKWCDNGKIVEFNHGLSTLSGEQHATVVDLSAAVPKMPDGSSARPSPMTACTSTATAWSSGAAPSPPRLPIDRGDRLSHNPTRFPMTAPAPAAPCARACRL